MLAESHNEDCQARNKLLVAEADDDMDQVVNPSVVLFVRAKM